jgi:hypothetical protein
MDEDQDPNQPIADREGVSVHAGFPNPAADKSLQTLDFNRLLVQHGSSTYMFRIRGDEWQDIGIFDGDIAVIDRALDPRGNDVTVWWDESRGEFALSHHNRMPPGASCWGVVTSTIHQFRHPEQHQKPPRPGTQDGAQSARQRTRYGQP